jgi:hypothetical protein
MKRTRTFVIIAYLLIITNGTAYAIITGAGWFDELIKDAKIIVKGQVNQIGEAPFEMIGFGVDVTMVLKGDGGEIPRQLYLESPLPLWPEKLGAPYAEGQMVLLVLRRKDGKLFIENNMGAILLATGKTTYTDDISAERKVFGELRAYLDQTKDETAKGLVLVLLSHLGTKNDR